jgi:flagellar basal body-associated protein FliL
MVQKAKLDLLENLPDIEVMDTAIAVDDSPLTIPPGSQERWAFNKLLFIGAPILIVLIVISAGAWFFLTQFVFTAGRGKVAPVAVAVTEKNEVSVAPAADPVKMNMAYFKDFLIDLKDSKGKSKILICDVAFDISEEKNAAEIEGRTDLRNIIYNAARSKSIVNLKSIDDRKKFKKELAAEMIKMLGDGVVKNVYFTNYVIM